MTHPARPHTGEELARAVQESQHTSTCTHLVTQPAKRAEYAPFPSWTHPGLQHWLTARGIAALYEHQALAASLAWEGRHVVLATATSSGKSLAYQLAVLSRLAQEPRATALYLTPTKALGNDQLGTLLQMCSEIEGLHEVHPSPYDGDTPTDARPTIRERSRLVVTNPDMLHQAILPNHAKWGRMLRNLHFIIIDEAHSYRGVFGAGVSLVLRRLLRLCARYGAHPTVILASATSNDPAAHASTLIGAPVEAVERDTAPRGPRTIMLWEPGFIEGISDEGGAPVRRAASTETASIMATLIAEGARTLAFVRSRRQAEITALRCAEELSSMGRPADAARVAAYRAGYLAEHRRALEQALDNGDLLGVASTNALELGIDVGGLDAVVTAGFPGTVASFWQQAGRAGRRGQGSLVTLVARDEPMDTYLIHHPEALLDKPLERTVFNPHNPHIVRGHVLCAAVEAPLSDAEIYALAGPTLPHELAHEGRLRRRPGGWFAVQPPGVAPPHAQVQLRGTGNSVAIVDATDGRLLGTTDESLALSQLHPGAVYLHMGEQFVVDELDLHEGVALVHPEAPEYNTYSRSTTDIRIVDVPHDEQKVVNPSPGLWVSNLEVEVTTQVTGYVMKSIAGETIGMVPLDLPAQALVTRAVAYTVDPLVLQELGITDVPGALHAAEHAAIGMLPLIATCDRWDIGGVSTALHADTGLPTVFVYDGTPGGAGFADCGYERFDEWIQATFEAVRSCACEAGCPSCVQSPKCGNGNNPLDKAGAIKLLGALCTMLGGYDPCS